LVLTVFAADPTKSTAQVINVTPAAGPVDRIVITSKIQGNDVLERSGMERNHSFVWPLVRIVLDSGKDESFPFSTRGLLF